MKYSWHDVALGFPITVLVDITLRLYISHASNLPGASHISILLLVRVSVK